MFKNHFRSKDNCKLCDWFYPWPLFKPWFCTQKPFLCCELIFNFTRILCYSLYPKMGLASSLKKLCTSSLYFWVLVLYFKNKRKEEDEDKNLFSVLTSLQVLVVLMLRSLDRSLSSESLWYKEMLLYLVRILTQWRDVKVIYTLINPGHCNLQNKSIPVRLTKIKWLITICACLGL